MLSALLSLAIVDASAIEIDIARDRHAVNYLFVDGVAMGEVTKKQNAHLSLPEGEHELWFSLDPKGAWEVCRGLVSGSTLVTLGGVCTGLLPGDGPMARARVAVIAFRPSATDALLSLDGSMETLIPNNGVRISVIRAMHSVRVTTTAGAPLCAGKVDLLNNYSVEVAIGVGSCSGLL